MSVRHPWARIREDRAASPGRHSPDYLEKHPMPPSTAASLPLASERPDARLGTPYPVPGEPKVQCKFCGTCRPVSEMSQIPELAWGPLCYDTDECTKRQLDKLYATRVPEVPALPTLPAEPAPTLSSPLEPLPKRVPAVVAEAVHQPEPGPEAADAAQQAAAAKLAVWSKGESLGDQTSAQDVAQASADALAPILAAHDEQDAAGAGQDRTEDEGSPEAAEEPPASDGDVQPGPYIDAMAAEHVQEYDPADEAAPVAEVSEPEDGGEGK